MEEKIVKVLILLLLAINSAVDWRKREISLISLEVFGVIGIGLNRWRGYQSFMGAAGGAGIGIVLLAAAFFTKEAIGFGDGLLICVTGIYLGFWKNLLLFFSSLMLCSFFGLALFLWGWFQGKDYRKKRLPFLMFTLPMGFYLAWM